MRAVQQGSVRGEAGDKDSSILGQFDTTTLTLNRRVLWALIELDCAVVGPASSVIQALAMIDAEAIDAAVLDVNLDGQMSYPIADALAARGVPFVFSTGYDKDTLLDGYRTFPVLQKPFHRSELSDTLAKLLTPNDSSAEFAIAAIAEASL
jgi:DNA-binding NtrC family response regulator